MAHAHPHGDHHHGAGNGRLLTTALALTLGFALVEAVAGWWSGSLALLGDAGHMLTDGASLGLAAFAAWLARRPPSPKHSYGLGRAELLAALLNALFMIAIVVAITSAAVERLITPRPVAGETVTAVAAIGLLINLAVVWLLSQGGQNVNTRGALLHVLGDLLGSVAALAAGVVITVTGWTPIDPILSLAIVALILFSSLRLLREALHLLLDGVPSGLDLATVGQALAELDGVREVHDLHIWHLSADRVALSAHLVMAEPSGWQQTIAAATRLLQERFGIGHVTLQPELPTAPVVVQLHPRGRR
ncbi:MAG: cation diffusion facilitator family transporter [Gammaproteobacteria bacterium]